MTRQNAIDVQNLTKRYKSGDRMLTVLDQVSFSLPPGAACSIMGPSGSGKTTLLGLCAGLDHPDEGVVSVNGTTLRDLTEEERAAFRRKTIGFVFQSFRLLSTLTALENVMVPLELLGSPHPAKKAKALLDEVGLSERMTHYPAELSGGEQQRVGLARAFIHEPSILLADEPTGNLDAQTAETVTHLLFELNKNRGTTLIIVTHNPDLSRKTPHILNLSKGRLVAP